MKEYIDEMLRLASDIVEGLLTAKDDDTDIDPELNLFIQQLAVISDRHTVARHAPDLMPSAENVTAAESVQDAESEQEEVESEAEAEVPEGIETIAEEEKTAESAEFEEEADADVEPEPESADAPVPQSDESTSSEESDAHVTVEDEPAAKGGAETSDEDAESVCEEVNEQQEPTAEAADDAAEEPVTDTVAESEADSEAVSESEHEAESEVEATPEDPHGCGVPYAELRRAFSLNDVFLYRRTLFGGSAARFDAALQAVASMSGVEELRRYLVEVEGVNLKSASAKDFIAVLSAFLVE